MNEDVKAEWVAALRSGEYNQTTGYLTIVPGSLADGGKPVGNCCLGVLCELAYKAGVVTREVDATEGFVKYDGERASLPRSVVSWAGLLNHNPLLQESVMWRDMPMVPASVRKAYSLAEMNDHGFNFNEVADAIERNLANDES